MEFTNEWFSPYHRDLFAQHLTKFSQQRTIFLEIGVHEGRSATWIIDNYLEHGDSTLTLIDPYLPFDSTTPVTQETRTRFLSNLSRSKYPDKVIFYENISSNILPHLFTAGLRYDVIYVDGSHLISDILEDAVLCNKILNSEGLLIFDDYESPPIKSTLDYFITTYSSEYNIIHQGYVLILQKKATRKMFDVFLFNGELDLLELRLREHGPVVDKFFIVEGALTFTGIKKDLFFERNRDSFDEWLLKIIYLPITEKEFPSSGPWERESFIRNYALSQIRQIGSDDDIVINSDLDEIVRTDLLMSLKKSPLHQTHSLIMDFYYYNCNWKKKAKWVLASIGPLSKINSLQENRIMTSRMPRIQRAGWHLSYFMTPEVIANKIRSFSHTELDQDRFKSLDNIKDAIRTGRDLFSRGNSEDCIPSGEYDSLPTHIKCLPPMFWRQS